MTDKSGEVALVPYPLAMVVCDAIHVDPATQKKTLLGLLDDIAADSFPLTYPGLAVHAAVTAWRGRQTLLCQIVDAEDQDPPIEQASYELEVSDPLAIVEIELPFGSLTFPVPGEYKVQLFVGNNFVIERRLHLTLTPGTSL